MAKIVHLTPYYEPHLGGVETHVKELNRLLTKLGHELTVICQQHDRSLPLEEKKDNVRIIRIPVADFYSRLPFHQLFDKVLFKFKMWTWIAKQGQLIAGADIIQIHDVFWWIWPLYPLVYFKTFLTFHGWEGRYPIQLTAKIHRYYNWMAAKKTLHVGDFIRHFYWDKPTAVVYGGVSDALLKQPVKTYKNKDQRWLANELKIVFLGRLEDVNAIEKYLEFLRLVKDFNPKVKITFVGDGSWRSECEQLGQVTGLVKDPSQYLKSADLVCASSYLSMLEAQALGKLVCGFYANRVKEQYLKLYPGAPLMMIENNPARMLERLKKISDEQLNNLSLKIRSFATTQTWSKVLQAYLKLWGLNNKN